MISIIIPAYNEERVIERCLSAILEDSRGEFDIIVVCNACFDNTANLARNFSDQINVIEVDKPSKTNALNIGDFHAKYFPRFYVDADVVLDSYAIRSIVDSMSNDVSIYAASPLPLFDLSNSSWVVKSYYSIWQSNSFFHSELSLGGSGVYVLSAKGRKTFDIFPDILLDDAFINNIIPAKNKRRLKNVTSVVIAPKNLLSLCKIKSRGKIGLNQFKLKYPELLGASMHQRDFIGFLKRIALSPYKWHQLLVYVIVMIFIRLYTNYKLSPFSKHYVWEKDLTSR